MKLTKITKIEPERFKVHPVRRLCRTSENKTRMTIQGIRYRVGNPNHPHYNLYRKYGFSAVFEEMGIVEESISHLQQKVEDLYGRYTSGHIYILSNPAWKGWYKVGMAVEATDRLPTFQTGSPFRDYKLEYYKHFKDRRSAEKEAHILLEKSSKSKRGEWFQSSLLNIKQQIETLKGETYAPINTST